MYATHWLQCYYSYKDPIPVAKFVAILWWIQDSERGFTCPLDTAVDKAFSFLWQMQILSNVSRKGSHIYSIYISAQCFSMLSLSLSKWTCILIPVFTITLHTQAHVSVCTRTSTLKSDLHGNVPGSTTAGVLTLTMSAWKLLHESLHSLILQVMKAGGTICPKWY